MVIQHNISAINSHRQLGINNDATAKNLEKLSSGFRVNRAADDAAGLAISEKMRGQIRGLNMAVTNCDNGVSLIQTAEGGLNETHAILHRMRELAVQSANGTYDDDVDRFNLNKEVKALKREIDRIAYSTHYNGINLLDGSLGALSVDQLSGGTFTDTLSTKTFPDGSVAAFADSLQKLGIIHQDPMVISYAVNNQVGINTYNSDFDGQAMDILITADEGGSGSHIAIRINGETFRGVFVDTASSIASSNNFDAHVDANTYVFYDDDGLLVASINIGGTLRNADSGIISGIQIGDSFIDNNGTSTLLLPASSGLETLYFTSTDAAYNAKVALGDAQLIFQIGANGTLDQRVGLHVDNMSSANLGLRYATAYNPTGTILDISIATQDEANDAIAVIDAAINQVSGTRADLGALQNRLEHTISNLGVTAENLTAAESTIRDVDMAKEMMDFTKNSILVQAAQSMLAQSTQLPQGVLSLLS